MSKVVVFLVVLVSAQSQSAKYNPGNCLEGDKHRELPCPQPETSDYRACFQWSDSTCCTAESTTQLANATVVNVDGFHWSRCDPPLSQRCQEYFKRIECFYRCSPNVAHWAINYPSAFANLPVCGQFCEDWFDACAADLTCAVDWITDWVYVNGENICKNSTCRTFRDIYGNGTGLCNTLWGSSFVYTNESDSDTSRQCLSLWWPQNQTNPNDTPIRNIFGSQVDTVTAPPCAGCYLTAALWAAVLAATLVAMVLS